MRDTFIIYDSKEYGLNDLSDVKIGDLFQFTYSNDEREVFKTKYTNPILVLCSGYRTFPESTDPPKDYEKFFTIITPLSSFCSMRFVDSIVYPRRGIFKDIKLKPLGTATQSLNYTSDSYGRKCIDIDIPELWKRWRKELIDLGSYIPLKTEDKAHVDTVDFTGEQINVGDKVVYTGHNDCRLRIGTVNSISDSGLSVNVDGYIRSKDLVYKIR